MKKLYLFLLLFMPIDLMAETSGEIVPVKGKTIKADIIKVTTDIVVYRSQETGLLLSMTPFEVQRITQGNLDIRVKDEQFYDFKNKYATTDGDIIYTDEKAQAIPEQILDSIANKSNIQTVVKMQSITQDKKRMSDPNYAIAQAMLYTGGISMGIGIPCLMAGSIICGIDMNAKTTKEAESISRAKTAGMILAGAGVALTVVSIPMTIYGKKMMNLCVQMNQNGAGVIINF